MFEVPKPLTTLGIGVDSIPESIRWSKVLTGNDLGMLGNVEALPTTEEVTYFLHQNVSIKGVISTFDQDKIQPQSAGVSKSKRCNFSLESAFGEFE